jgi:energy-coupling factor transport system permease protein
MSMRVFEGFKFTKRQTPIHNMDPRAKFLLVTVIFVASLLFTNLYVLILIFVLQMPIIVLARSLRRWAATLKGGLVLATLIFVMNVITGSSVTYAASMTIRFLALLSSFSIFFMTTSPDDLGLALEQAHVPYTLTFTFTTAVRLVPTMAVDAQTVVDAQKSRGLELEKGNLLKRIRNYVPILIPLIVSAIRRSIELAEALESRAFGLTEKRQSLIVLKMRSSDYAVFALSLAALALAVYTSLYVKLPVAEIPIEIPSLWPF